MSIFQPTVPAYETIATKTVAHVESSGGGLFGLWPRPFYEGDSRRGGNDSGGLFGSFFGGLFSAPQPAYETTPTTAQAALLGARSKKASSKT